MWGDIVGKYAACNAFVYTGVPEGACIIRNIVLISEHAIILIACSFYMYLVVQPEYPKLTKTNSSGIPVIKKHIQDTFLSHINGMMLLPDFRKGRKK